MTAVVVAGAAACGPSAKPGAGGASASSPVPAATTRSLGSPVTSAPARPTASRGPSRCSTADLQLTVGTGNGAEGTIYYPLDFTNVSGSACMMYGYPGVAFVTGPGGSLIGARASLIGTIAPTLITLKTGATAHATLGVSDVLISNNCLHHQVLVNWVQVFPPGQYSALFARLSMRGCADRALVIMVVGPVSSGP